MTVVVVFFVLGTGIGFGVVTGWRLRGLLAEHEARQLAVALGGAVDDYLEEHDLRCNAEFRAIVAEERLRQHGIEMT